MEKESALWITEKTKLFIPISVFVGIVLSIVVGVTKVNNVEFRIAQLEKKVDESRVESNTTIQLNYKILERLTSVEERLRIIFESDLVKNN